MKVALVGMSALDTILSVLWKLSSLVAYALYTANGGNILALWNNNVWSTKRSSISVITAGVYDARARGGVSVATRASQKRHASDI